jgi:hypothetical protein
VNRMKTTFPPSKARTHIPKFWYRILSSSSEENAFVPI